MKLNDLVNQFLGKLKGRLGEVARPNGTFFATNVATTALQRIRLDVLRGASMTEEGHRFVTETAAYLALLAAGNWNRRGLAVRGSARLDGSVSERQLSVTASRTREGNAEEYRQDFLRDTFELLIKPPQHFPYLQGQVYAMSSLVYPSPEYLYMYGTYLLQSPRAAGNWPKAEQVGGLEQDFRDARAWLVDDLHKDVGLPVDDEKLRSLSWWVVFPPYGWQMNEGQSYNAMTLVDQIADKKTVSVETGLAYLRALLESQTVFLRNLAARTLMVFGHSPQSVLESDCYTEALLAADRQEATKKMAYFRWILHGNDRQAPMPPQWFEECSNEWKRLTMAGPREPWRDDHILSDPEYQQLARLPREQRPQQRQGLERLLGRHPGNWFLRSAYGGALMEGPDPARGEQMLRQCIEDTPDCPDAHLNLGTRLKWQGRRDEAMSVFENAVLRWPRNHQAVDSCMWLLTDGMVEAPGNSS